MVITDQKSIIDTHIKKKKQCKQNTKDGHQTTREKNKRERKENRLIKQLR